VFRAGQAQPRFVNQSRGLEGVSCWLVEHLDCRKAPKLLINQGQEFLGGSGFALLHAIENARDLAHARRVDEPARKSMPQRRLSCATGNPARQRLTVRQIRLGNAQGTRPWQPRCAARR
jgi:hypothetical protein